MEDYYFNSSSQPPPTTDTTTDRIYPTIFDMYGFHTPDSQDYSDMIFNYENDSNFTSNYQNHSSIISIYQSYSYTFIISVVIYIIFALGLPSILMAIYSLYSMVRSDHVAPIYVINLLITDLIQLCYMIVPVVSNVNRTIRIISSIYLSGLVASVYFMVCISLERYLSVYPVCVELLLCLNMYIIFAILLLLPFPLFIFFLTGTLKALSASISVPSDEKRRIVGVLVLVLLIYTLLFLPRIILNLDVDYGLCEKQLATEYSPYFLMFGREARYLRGAKRVTEDKVSSLLCKEMSLQKIESVHAEVMANIKKSQDKVRKRKQERGHEDNFKVGVKNDSQGQR
ncbi:G-protein coupled receptor 4-like [Micropterus salmoides]|uniref:G-protein coupled receptor 4-like n=1 Tax=Micropterus salmoides TaxID=27706 RepID=UPI0018EB8C74|nr:G-protein coupled receptor 4-like [Micropterus salmoides]